MSLANEDAYLNPILILDSTPATSSSASLMLYGGLSIFDTTQSISLSTGSVLLAGGLGVSGNMYGTFSNFNNIQVLNSVTIPNLIVSTNATIATLFGINATIGSIFSSNATIGTIFSSNSTITNLLGTNLNYTNITSTNILNTNSSIGTINSININNTNLTITNILGTTATIPNIFNTNITTTSLLATTSISSANLYSTNITSTNIVGTNSTINNLISGILGITSTQDAISSITGGSIITVGGISIGKSAYIGSTIDSTSYTNGALVVAGGVGISKSLSIGPNTLFSNTSANIGDNIPIINYNNPNGLSDGGIAFQRYQIANTNGNGQIVGTTHNADYYGTVQAGSSTTTIIFPAGASTVTGYYNNWWLKMTSGAANNNVVQITSYSGASLTAAVSPALTAAPGTGSSFSIYGGLYATIFHDDTLDDIYLGYTNIIPGTEIQLVNGYTIGSSYIGLNCGNVNIYNNSSTVGTNNSTGTLVVGGDAGFNGNVYANNIYTYGGSTNASLLNVVTTTGDLYTYATAGTRLPAGTYGQVLTSNTTASTGLQWLTSNTIPNSFGSEYTFASSAGASTSTITGGTLKISLTTGTLLGGTYAIEIGYRHFTLVTNVTAEFDAYLNGANTTGTLIHTHNYREIVANTVGHAMFDKVQVVLAGGTTANVGLWFKNYAVPASATSISNARIAVYRLF